MPTVFVMYSCSNQSNQESTRSFYQERNYLGGKRLYLRSGGAESDNTPVCSDHVVNETSVAMFMFLYLIWCSVFLVEYLGTWYCVLFVFLSRRMFEGPDSYLYLLEKLIFPCCAGYCASAYLHKGGLFLLVALPASRLACFTQGQDFPYKQPQC